MSQEKIVNTLLDFGLTRIEAKIYVLLAKNGSLKAHDVGRFLKISKQRLYPSLKNLQSKGLVNSTLEYPSKFSAVSFEKALDLFAKTKIEEAKTIHQNKNDLLKDWQSIVIENNKDTSGKFTVIEGRKYVYSKIQQMIQETKKQLSTVTTIPSLIRAYQSGILESVFNHPLKSKVQFRFLAEITEQNYNSIKTLLEKTPQTDFNLKGRNPERGLKLSSRMVIRDNEELLFFTTSEQKDYSCLWTNCSELVHSFSSVFEDLWLNSTDSKQKIREIETGILPHETQIFKKISEAQVKYNEVLKKAKKEIFIVTSADRLRDFQKEIPKIKEINGNNISIKIMSPIVKDNYKVANKLQNHSQVRHIPQGYLDTTIVDSNHLFQFNDPPSITNGIERKQNFQNTFYTNNSEYVTKTKNMLENIWCNSSNTPQNSLEFLFNPLKSFSPPSKSVSNDPSSEVILGYLRSKPVILRTSSGEVTEKEVVAKIINQNQFIDSNRKVVKCYCKIGYAAINPPNHFNLPKMLISITQIDKKSSFGAEDRLVFHIWKETKEGFRYVPVAIIGDNPNFPIEILKRGQYNNTPAATNFQLVKREEIQVQLYGNTFLASWTLPIMLSDKLVLAPGTIILETYGKVKTKRVLLHYPTKTKYNVFYNAFDSFVTYLYGSLKYVGPGTDGLFLRDAFIEIGLP